MALTQTQIDTIQSALDLLEGNYEKPDVDEKTADILRPLYADVFGFPTEISFLEGLRDAPFSTLLGAFAIVYPGDIFVDVVDYLKKAGIEKPLAGDVAERIVRGVNTQPAFPTEIAAYEALRDAPYSAILKLLLNVT